MRKIIFALLAAALSMSLSAQEPDLETITKTRANKADSLTAMMAKVYATQAAMNHPTAEARATLLKAFEETLNLDNQDEDYKEGNALANEYYKISQDMKNRSGIVLNRKAYTQALLERYNDTTVTMSTNDEARAINVEARHLIEGLTALHKDSAAAIAQADLINIKTDSLSRNMGRFFGLQLQSTNKKKGRSESQVARLFEGFNNAINIDESNKPLVDGRMLGNDFIGLHQNIKKQLGLNIKKEIFDNAIKEVLNDAKVPTIDDFNDLNAKTNAYFKETQAYAKENSPEALAQKGLGKKYIENLLATDASYTKTQSGLVYKMITPGKGKKFEANDKIKVMYKGTHVDGKTFDESKQPITFAPSQVVPGFREALLMMSPGAKMIAVLPQDLAYGARGAGKDIKPFETLIFEIETIGLDTDEKAKAEGKASPAEAKKTAVKAQPADSNKTAVKAQPAKKSSAKKASSKKVAGKKSASKRKK